MILLTVGILVVLCVVTVERLRTAKRLGGLVAFELMFPHTVDAERVVAFFASLAGLRSRYGLFWTQPHLVLETHSSKKGVRHFLLAPANRRGVVTSRLRAALPDVRIETTTAPMPNAIASTELVTTSLRRPLRAQHPDRVSAAVLNSLLPLGANEHLVVQWIVSPAEQPKPARLQGGKSSGVLKIDDYEVVQHAEALREERQKRAEPLLWCAGRVGAATKRPERARYLIGRVVSAFSQLNAPGVRLKSRATTNRPTRLINRTAPTWRYPALLNAAELAAAVGWPIGDQPIPGLKRGGCRQLPASPEIPTDGCVVAQSTYPGNERQLAIAPADRLLHLHFIGPTGTGKSTALLNLITQDMHTGRSVVVIDPKGDLVTECLQRVPADRLDDVVVLDPADDERPVGLNLLATDPANAELATEHVTYIFRSLFADSWGPRTDDLLRSALLTLMQRPNMTLVELPLLLTNAAFQRPFMAAIKDDVVGLAPFWSWYQSISAAERAQVMAPLMNKLRAVLRKRIRYCVGQAEHGLNLERVINGRSLVFVPLRKGVLGDDAAALLGSLFVSRLWQVVQGRSGMPENRRRPLHLYIDEVQDYLRLPTSVGDMLAQARGLKLGVTVAHQHLGQLPTELRQDLLSNCRSRVVFQTTAKDARAFEPELRPYLTAQDLQGLGRFEAVLQLAVGQQVAPPATGLTLPPPEPLRSAASVLERSRQRYGRQRADVEAEMRARHDLADHKPIGRRTRSSS